MIERLPVHSAERHGTGNKVVPRIQHVHQIASVPANVIVNHKHMRMLGLHKLAHTYVTGGLNERVAGVRRKADAHLALRGLVEGANQTDDIL